MEFVAFRLTATQLTEIHNSVTEGMEHPRITGMGVVVGLLGWCLSEAEPESKPIDTVSCVVNVRALVAPRATRLILQWHRWMGIYPVNATFWFPTGTRAPKGVNPYDCTLVYATGIRKSLEKLKDPGLIKEMGQAPFQPCCRFSLHVDQHQTRHLSTESG